VLFGTLSLEIAFAYPVLVTIMVGIRPSDRPR